MTQDPHHSFRGIVLTIMAMLVFATMDGLSRFLVTTYSIGQILWIRYMVFSLFALWFCRNKMRQHICSKRPWLQIIRAAVLIAEAFFFIASFRYLSLDKTHAITASTPLIVTVLAPIFLGEHVGRQRWIAVLAGFAGTLIIIRPGFETMSWVIVLPLLAALFFAMLQIMTRLLGRTDPGTTTLLYSAIVGLVIISGIGPFFWTEMPLHDLGLMVLIGLLGATAHFLLILALRHSHASTLQPYTYVLLVWAVVVGFVAFGDMPGPWTLCGAVIVVASGLYSFVQEQRSKNGSLPPINQPPAP